ncbi:MAG TPA: integrase, partial [Pseudolabrys sp.]|nr:integrase [Pseudolabrys sp.]
LRLTPSKTENTSEIKVAFDLTECPMVMAELATIPDDKRKGPLITDERTGLPYRYDVWGAGWRRDRKAANISPQVWNRDLRAGGLTEGDLAGASLDDRSKIAGHANKRITARVYDRNTLEAHRRQAAARRLHRGKGDGEDL